MGSVVKEKVGELEDITREGISNRIRKEVVGCVYAVVGKENFLVQFEDGQKKEISSSLLVFSVRKMSLIWMSHYLILLKKNKVDC